jgi:hypothetical protein
MKIVSRIIARALWILLPLSLTSAASLVAQPNYRLMEESLSPSFTTLRTYTFDTGTEGWAAATVTGFNVPEYSWRDGKLAMKGTDGDFLVGFWQSSLDAVSKEQEHLYHIAVEVSTDITARRLVPQFTIRTVDPNFGETNSLFVTSFGNGAFSPLTSNCAYHLFYSVCDGGPGDTQGLAWDMINYGTIGQDDDPWATLFLDSATVSAAPLDSISTPTTVVVWDFDTGSEGWNAPDTFPPHWATQNPEIGSQFTKVIAVAASGSLQLKRAGESSCGYWLSPFEVIISPAKMYIGEFHLRSDKTNPAYVPQIHISAASENWQGVVGKSLICPNNGTCCPGLSAEAHSIYFVPSPDWAGSHIGFLFAIISYDSNENGTVFLDKLVVKSMDLLVVPTPTPYTAAKPARWLLYE